MASGAWSRSSQPGAIPGPLHSRSRPIGSRTSICFCATSRSSRAKSSTAAWRSINRGATMRALRTLLVASVALGVCAGAATAQDKITITTPTKTVSFGPVFLPLDTGGFKKRNIDASIVVLTGGMPASSAVLGGDAQFTVVADDELLKVADSGKMIRIHNFVNSFTQNFQVRNAILAERKVSMTEPWRGRIKKTEGITGGSLGP